MSRRAALPHRPAATAGQGTTHLTVSPCVCYQGWESVVEVDLVGTERDRLCTEGCVGDLRDCGRALKGGQADGFNADVGPARCVVARCSFTGVERDFSRARGWEGGEIAADGGPKGSEGSCVSLVYELKGLKAVNVAAGCGSLT